MHYIEGDYVQEVLPEPHVSFCEDSLRRVSWGYVLWLLMAFVLSVVAYRMGDGGERLEIAIRPSLYLYFLIVIVHMIHRLKGGSQLNILSPEILLMAMYSLFHVSYALLYAFNLVPYNDHIFLFSSSYVKSLFIVNLGLISFLLGYEFFGSKSSIPKPVGVKKRPTGSWCAIGLFCLIVGVATHLGILFLMAPTFFKYGYQAIQNIDEYTTSFILPIIWRNGFHVMLFGVVLYSISSALRYGKLFNSKTALVLVIVYFTMVILEGDRGPVVQMGAPLLLIRHYLVKRIKIPYLIIMAIGAMVLFSAIGPLIRNTGYSTYNPSRMLKEFKYQRQTGAITWMNPLIEMGGSLGVVNLVCHEVPSANQPYWHGDSWRDAAFHTVPFLQGYALRQGWGTWAPSAWLNKTYFPRAKGGRAFTVAAEGYLNFGYLGVFIELFLLGAFVRWLTVRFSRNPSAMWALIMMGCIGASVMLIRNHVQVVSQTYARLFVLGILLNIFLRNEPTEYADDLVDASIGEMYHN